MKPTVLRGGAGRVSFTFQGTYHEIPRAPKIHPCLPKKWAGTNQFKGDTWLGRFSWAAERRHCTARHQGIRGFEVVAPVGADGLLTSDIPHIQLEALLHHASAGRLGGLRPPSLLFAGITFKKTASFLSGCAFLLDRPTLVFCQGILSDRRYNIQTTQSMPAFQRRK